MPPLGRSRTDEAYLGLLEYWTPGWSVARKATLAGLSPWRRRCNRFTCPSSGLASCATALNFRHGQRLASGTLWPRAAPSW